MVVERANGVEGVGVGRTWVDEAGVEARRGHRVISCISVRPSDLCTTLNGHCCWDKAIIHRTNCDGRLGFIELFILVDVRRERHDVISVVI